MGTALGFGAGRILYKNFVIIYFMLILYRFWICICTFVLQSNIMKEIFGLYFCPLFSVALFTCYSHRITSQDGASEILHCYKPTPRDVCMLGWGVTSFWWPMQVLALSPG